MISVEAARARVLAGLVATPAEMVALSAAAGRILARPLVARLTQPPAALSAMDGYALQAADAAPDARLRVIGAAPAGQPFAGSIATGEAIRLFTGSVVPDGADCVVMQEDVSRAADWITLATATPAGRHIRPAGQDFAAGDLLLGAGTRLTPRAIGLAAAANHPWLAVHRRPRVAILATGDEIVLPGEAIPPGGIVSSNSHALAAMVREAGAVPVLLPLVGDSLDAIVTALDGAIGCDLLVSSGGVSVGDHDLMPQAFAAVGVDLEFWKIAMRPGKPLMHGRWSTKAGSTKAGSTKAGSAEAGSAKAGNAMPVLGLPGNPVSALICATFFLLPALAVLSGQTPTPPATEPARLRSPLAANDGRTDFLRARLDTDESGRLCVAPFAQQASSLLRILAAADALIVRHPGAEPAAAGETVDIIRLDRLAL